MDYYKVNPEKGGRGEGLKTGKKHINKSKWNTEKPSFVNSEKSTEDKRGEGDKRGKNYKQRRSEKERKKKKNRREWNTKSK